MNVQERSVSIVIAARNVASKIENCLMSVIAQTHLGIEIVVVDGGSDDGTVDILRRYSDRVKWTSEPDGGVNEAQWKGVVRSSSEWILFLGADDYLSSPKALAQLFDECPGNLGEYDIVTGHVLYEDGRLYRSNRLEFIRLKNCLHGQGALYRRHLFQEKRYDLSLQIYYDYEFNLWALTSGKRVYSTDALLSILGCGGLSDRPRWRNYVEDMRVRARYVKGVALYAANLFAVARYARKSLRCYLSRER